MSKRRSPLAEVRALMDDYARRGVFRSFSRQSAPAGVAAFNLLWHRERTFDLVVDTRKRTIQIPIVLPEVPAHIYRDFKTFVAAHHGDDLPDHRRIDPAKARVRCANRRGNVALTMTIKDDDYSYALQRLIHLVHETYLMFLADGRYGDYLTEQLGATTDLG